MSDGEYSNEGFDDQAFDQSVDTKPVSQKRPMTAKTAPV